MVKVKQVSGRRRRRKLAACLQRQGGRCWYCERAVPADVATLDHLAPVSRGGRNNIENLVAACQWCNNKRGPQDAEKFRAKVRSGKSKPGPVDYINQRAAINARKRAGNQAEIEAYKAFAAHQQQTRGWHEQDTGFEQDVRLA